MNCDVKAQGRERALLQQGYTLAGALVLIAILSIFMAVSVPVWDRIKQRENEAELVFRGQEYVEAIARYHQKYNSYPPDIDSLYKMKFLRRLYKDPMTASGEWKVLHPDSLVETGEAGAISQPGGKTREDPEGSDNQKSSSKSQKSDSSEDRMNSSDKEKDEGEEEEEEVKEDQEEKSIGPVVGVRSRSKKTSLLTYNGQSNYNKWIFAYVPQQPQQQQPPNKPGDDKGGKNSKPIVKPPTTPGVNNQGQNEDDSND